MGKKGSKSGISTPSLTPYITVRGGDQAIEFYKNAFGAKELNRINTTGSELVQHAELKICGSSVYLCDEFVDAGILSPQSIGGSAVLLHLEVEDAIKIWSAAMEAGAVEIYPLAEVSWGGICGKLVDPYGHNWSIGGKYDAKDKSVLEHMAGIEIVDESGPAQAS